jgi:hypothetical protein
MAHLADPRVTCCCGRISTVTGFVPGLYKAQFQIERPMPPGGALAHDEQIHQSVPESGKKATV